MYIKDLFDVEPCKDLGYARVKLELGCSSYEEEDKIKTMVFATNSEIPRPDGKLMILAYLKRHSDGRIELEKPLVSAYYTDLCEVNISDSMLKPHAFERCKEFVKELYDINSLKVLEDGAGDYIKLPKINEPIAG